MAKKSSTVLLAASVSAATAIVAYALLVRYRYNRKKSASHQAALLADLNNKWSQKRQEERTGRIRAEVKLRTALKQLQQLTINSNASSSEQDGSSLHNTNNSDNNNKNNRTMLMRCIGTVVSPYTKRMGTPRQAALVPASRGYISLTGVPAESLCGIEGYSHVWILFEFHANTNVANNNYENGTAAAAKGQRTKIRPPRGGGVKVGQLATRSPHRPNPIGLSLVTLERWDAAARTLHVTGLDLVHGTPVYDIKPAVPWDVPGYGGGGGGYGHHCLQQSLSSSFKVPPWVSNQDDALQKVEFAACALAQLQACVAAGHMAPLYSNCNNSNSKNNDNDTACAAAVETVRQILAQDPRSSHKGLKSNQRGSSTTAAVAVVVDGPASPPTVPSSYSIVFCETKVSFVVTEEGATVTEVVPIDFDASQYVDGVPLISGSSME